MQIITDIKQLKTISIHVDTCNFDIVKQLAPIMINYCKTYNGAGLAAIQVGFPMRFFVTAQGEVIINPIITTNNGNFIRSIEGCLSFPGKEVTSIRFSSIVVNYTTLDNKEDNIYLTGFKSILWQHEIDHINGITMFDRQVHES